MFEQIPRLVSAVIVGIVVSFTISAQRYPIKLDPFEKAGQAYRLDATTTDTTTAEATASGQLLKKAEDSFKVELSAHVTIVEASNGWATRKRFRILSSKVIRGDRTSQILPNGTEVIASIQNGQTVYEVSQKLVDEETAGYF